MIYYINCIKKNDALSRDIKELVPTMNIRRRMSNILKVGVSTALDCLTDFEEYGNIDGIVTSTWLGCIADSEKFLSNIIRDKEQLLNPTPFIQSTFNTIGAQVALIKGLKCYNNTIVNGASSFDGALLDSVLQLSTGEAKAVLLGHFDEVTPTVQNILSRLKVGEEIYDGAIFCVITKEELPCSVAKIVGIETRDEVGSSWENLAANIYRIIEERGVRELETNILRMNIECI